MVCLHVRSSSRQVSGKKFVIFSMLFAFLIIYSFHEIEKHKKQCSSFSLSNTVPMWKLTLNFAKLNFSNETGSLLGYYVVPNYIHYIHFGGKPISYIYFICLLSVLKNQKPEKIFFHYNNQNVFTGKYWSLLKKVPKLKDILLFRKIQLPEKIFSHTINQKWRYQHASSFLRIKILIQYGGIYLDSDCYLVKNINNFRRFETTVSWNEGYSMGNHVIVAHKDARFLKRYLDCFHTYDRTDQSAGVKPLSEILELEPHLVHRVRELFGDVKLIHKLYGESWVRWRDMYVMHLQPTSQHKLKVLSYNKRAKFPADFNETNIAYYPITLRDMAYDVYDTGFFKINWPKQKLDLLLKRNVVIRKPKAIIKKQLQRRNLKVKKVEPKVNGNV